MMKRKRIRTPTSRLWTTAAAIVLLCGLCGLLQSASYTLTTYYPSPVGIYGMLTTTAQTILARDGGRVGIGTTDPQSRLDILGDDGEGGAGFRGLIMRNNLSDGANKGGVAILGARKDNEARPFTGLALWDQGTYRGVSLGGGGWSLPDATLIRFFTAPAYSESPNEAVERMRIGPNGDVGIGTASPQNRLHLVGDFRLDNGTLELGELPADPAAGHSRDGMIYYNATQESIRVFEGGSWKNLRRELECSIVASNEPSWLTAALCAGDEQVMGGSCTCNMVGDQALEGRFLSNGFECYAVGTVCGEQPPTAKAVCCKK